MKKLLISLILLSAIGVHASEDIPLNMKNMRLCLYMSRKGPRVGQGMLDFAEDLRCGVVSQLNDCILGAITCSYSMLL